MGGIIFKSINNIEYFYNNDTGYIELYKNQSIKENNEDEHFELSLVSNEDVCDYLFSGPGFRHIVLELTQGCNFRCKYCCYGEHYENTRDHDQNKFMTFESAKKAVDYYMSCFKKIEKKNLFKQPILGFYGGEPLLNYTVLKQTVEYVCEKYPEYEFNFAISTNGLLLSNEVEDFLVKHNFGISVSLDGDKENHDRNRVKINGEGSFDEVFSNITRFKNKYPEYTKFSILGCFDLKTDLIKVNKFFKDNNLIVSNFSRVNDHETNYYDNFSEDDNRIYIKNVEILKSEFINLMQNNKMLNDTNPGLMHALFLRGFLDFQLHPLNNAPKNPLLPYTGSCIPGTKMYISIDEKIHTCERISNHFPIGDLDNGLDYDKIAEIVNSFNSNQDKCRNCNVSSLCALCYAYATDNDKITISEEFCDRHLENMKNILIDYVNIMENNPTEFDRLVTQYFSQLYEMSGFYSC